MRIKVQWVFSTIHPTMMAGRCYDGRLLDEIGHPQVARA
jgi:hypothetical protein